MKLGNKMSVATAAVTIALGGLTLAGCGGSQAKPAEQPAAQGGGAAGSCGGDAKKADEAKPADGTAAPASAGEAKPAGEGGGEHSCGGNSCSG